MNWVGKASPCLYERESQAVLGLSGCQDNSLLGPSLVNDQTCSMTTGGPTYTSSCARHATRHTKYELAFVLFASGCPGSWR